VARNYVNDEETTSVPTTPKDELELLIVRVLNDRKTRQEHVFEV